jgi:hypothetical protein
MYNLSLVSVQLIWLAIQPSNKYLARGDFPEKVLGLQIKADDFSRFSKKCSFIST